MPRIRAFISSTYEDLKAHRAYVIDRLRTGGIDLDPMENWTAASDAPKQLSQDRVKDCDVCILLIGFRLGYVPEGEVLSITQMEYAEAIRQGLEVLVYVANEQADWPAGVLDELERDPRIRKWRAAFADDKLIGKFGPNPESLDVQSALLRLYGQGLSPERRSTPEFGFHEKHPINIRACSGSGAALIMWRAERPISGCLGFAIHRRTLGTAGISEDILVNHVGFFGDRITHRGPTSPTNEWPVQRFRWVDVLEDNQEVRYRVVPVIGPPETLTESVDPDTGSEWTRWISSKTDHTPGILAYFNNRGPVNADRLRQLGIVQPATKRTSAEDVSRTLNFLGGELRRILLASLAGARKSNKRVFVAVSGLDDPDIIRALTELGEKLSLVLEARSQISRTKSAAAQSAIRQQLMKAGVNLFPRLVSRRRTSGNNFMVLCDELGTPGQVWVGSGDWTKDAFCANENSVVVVESATLARAFLDRWESLRQAGNEITPKLLRANSRPAQIQAAKASITLWNTPTKGEPELRDAARLVRGAREGVLFLMRNAGTQTGLLKEILQLGSEELFIQGISVSASGNITVHDPRGKEWQFHGAKQIRLIGATVVLIDPFGPHPVVITGSHDLSSRNSAKNDASLLIIENAAGLAAEFAVQIVRLFDHYRFHAMVSKTQDAHPSALDSHDTWQQAYFEKYKRTEFNFLFGTLAPGL